MSKGSIKIEKRQVVIDAIYNAALDLFTENGFDETTIEDVANAAGVSRRNFFRYFASKDDLLALSIKNYGVVLSDAVKSAPSSHSPFDVVREAVLSAMTHTAALPRTREVILIASRSSAARQAHMSRLTEVEDSLAKAFATRLRNASRDQMNPRMLAGLTLLILNSAISSWFTGEQQNLDTAAKRALANLNRIVCGS
jgi:AcrR family transcriptional regulator